MVVNSPLKTEKKCKTCKKCISALRPLFSSEKWPLNVFGVTFFEYFCGAIPPKIAVLFFLACIYRYVPLYFTNSGRVVDRWQLQSLDGQLLNALTAGYENVHFLFELQNVPAV